MKRACKDCLFFVSDKNEHKPKLGECRYNPPIVDADHYFPETNEDLWCGKLVADFKPQEDSL